MCIRDSYNVGERMLHWGKLGAFWGGLWGLLFGSAMFFVPGLGPILVAGPLVGWIVGALEGAVVVGGVSAIGAGLVGLGIPRDSVLQYETALRIGKYVVVTHGTAEKAARAREVITGSGPEAWHEHEFQPSEATSPAPSSPPLLAMKDRP